MHAPAIRYIDLLSEAFDYLEIILSRFRKTKCFHHPCVRTFSDHRILDGNIVESRGTIEIMLIPPGRPWPLLMRILMYLSSSVSGRNEPGILASIFEGLVIA